MHNKNKQGTVKAQFTFGQLFKYFRLQSGFQSIPQFADALAERNIIYCESYFYHWQSESKIPQSRQLILAILEVFIENGAVTHLIEANLFLEAANKGYLTQREQQIFELDTYPENCTVYEDYEEYLTETRIEKLQKQTPIRKIKRKRFNILLEPKLYSYLQKVANKKSLTKADILRDLIQKQL